MTLIQEQTICMILNLMKTLKRKNILDDSEIVEVMKECPEVYKGYLQMLEETRKKKDGGPEEADECPEEVGSSSEEVL